MTAFRLQALTALLRRYAAIFHAAWTSRAERDIPKREPHELEFQPAHLELVETPAHPAAHWSIRIVGVLSLSLLAIMIFGRLDIVASARGKLIPNAKVKVVQPALTGVVREIAVRDGDRVTAGQLLMKLDAAQASADSQKAEAARIDAELAGARAQSLLAAQRDSRLPLLQRIDEVPQDRQAEAQRLAEGGYREYSDKISSSRAELTKREAELDSTRAQIAKLVATAPLARQNADHYRELSANKYVSQSDYNDKEQAAISLEHEIRVQQSHARELEASVAGQRADIGSVTSQFRRQQLDELEKATQQLAQNRNDESKANTRQALLTLTSPVAGTVQQLSVHTLGGVVTTAQNVMEIVPDDALEVLATIENKDIGFVSVGQRAAIKIEAFPYTRFGMVEGTVIDVANDAVPDKKLGLAFTARIRLASNRMRIENRWTTLSAGMAVTAEIKTGKRSVAEYFLGPLVESVQESMRER